MEKGRPHYPLSRVQEIVRLLGTGAFTQTALSNAVLMGVSRAQAVAVVCGLQRSMFYKSMTTHADHRIWQDVYHAPCPNGRVAYVKLTLIGDVVVIQFKER